MYIITHTHTHTHTRTQTHARTHFIALLQKTAKTFVLTCTRNAQFAIRASDERTSMSRRTSGIIVSIHMMQLWFRANLIATLSHTVQSRVRYLREN